MWELAQTATTCYLKLCICNVRCEKSLMPVRQNRHQMEPHRSHLPDTPDSHNYSCKTERGISRSRSMQYITHFPVQSRNQYEIPDLLSLLPFCSFLSYHRANVRFRNKKVRYIVNCYE
ncbi:uncharacterized protein LOC113469073 isoform X1 [Diaphorina citri]|uniref:Uncharacterized protein LOC113469073 isoform X1 n=1 Tax=Diaphorina citri TaxID=121845 RepID=A0A3Q0J1E3_DIACI|nr:uncharacterized protein LOC113469073 isoform X1 [Diaphorina citri]